MLITLLSDLHLESQMLSNLTGTDVLLLAGDTAEVKNLPRYNSFFREISEKFGKIFIIAGNHEFYGGDWDTVIKSMREILSPWDNIRVLENEATEIAPDLVLFGATMWTDFNKEDWASIQECKKSMNDYYQITRGKTKAYGTTFLHPDDVLERYYDSFAALKLDVESCPTKKFIVMTHHAPSHKSIHLRFEQLTELNGGFINNLDNFIWNHPNIKFWVHGHVHNSFDYNIATCRVMCNPRGYGKENKFFFKNNFTFEV
jgi:predicted phosphohydrolase